MNHARCPGAHNLQSLLQEDDCEGDSTDLFRHLETCADCQHTLEGLAADPADWDDVVQEDRDVVGVELFIMREPDGKRMARIGRFNTPHGPIYEVHDSKYIAQGGPTPVQIVRTPTQETRGQLRLIRAGSVLSYQVKDETIPADYKELYRTEFGTEALKLVLFAVNPGQDNRAVDARLIDLRIQSGGPPPGLPPGGEVAPEPHPEPAPKQSRGKIWLMLAVITALVLSGWLAWRGTRRVGDKTVRPVAAPSAQKRK